jgi:hypothetical protein
MHELGLTKNGKQYEFELPYSSDDSDYGGPSNDSTFLETLVQKLKTINQKKNLKHNFSENSDYFLKEDKERSISQLIQLRQSYD